MAEQKPISADELERHKAHMRTVIREVTGIKINYGDVIQGGDSGITDAHLHEAFRDIIGPTAQNDAGNLRAIQHLTPAGMGPSEREFVSKIAGYGLAMLQKINGGPSSEATPAMQARLETLLSDPGLLDAYSQINDAVRELSEDFPPILPGEKQAKR